MKYIRKHINEGVKLPSKQQQKVSLEDITKANSNYIKTVVIPQIFNDVFNKHKELKAVSPTYTATKIWLFQILQEDGQSDFSPSIVKVTPSQGKYIVTLGIYYQLPRKTIYIDGVCVPLECNDSIMLIAGLCKYEILAQHNDIISDINFIYLPDAAEPYSVGYSLNEIISATLKKDKERLIKCIDDGIKNNMRSITEIMIHENSSDFNRHIKYYVYYANHCVNKFVDDLGLSIHFYADSDEGPGRRGEFNEQHLQAVCNAYSKENIKFDHMDIMAELNPRLFSSDAFSSVSNIAIDYDNFYIGSSSGFLYSCFSDITLGWANNRNKLYRTLFDGVINYIIHYGSSVRGKIKYFPSSRKFFINVDVSRTGNYKDIDADTIIDNILEKHGKLQTDHVISFLRYLTSEQAKYDYID